MAQESVLRIVIDSRNAERNARNIANELQSIERNGNYATRSMDSMSVATRSLVGYMGGLVTIGAAVNKMDVYTGLQNRLKLVTNSQTELNTAMSDTFAIAQKTASSWDSAAMVYQRFADNAVRLNITMKETAALTETVAKAISVSGGSAASAEAALMQFGQALASGVLRGEEFNSIAEQAPGLLKAIAFGLDTNVGSLRAMAAAGKITGDVLVQSLTKAQPYIDDLFNKTDFTIAASFTKLSNEVTKFIGEAGKGSGAAAGLSDAISVLAENLGTIANIAVIGGVAMLTKAIATQTVAIHGSISAMVQRRALEIAGLQNNIRIAALEVQRTRTVAALAATEINLSRVEYNNASTRAARAAATVRLTQAEIAHRIALNQTTAATAAQTAAEGALTSARSFGVRALALVGGPIGAITIGVAALAAGYMYMSAKTAEATAKLAEQGRVADQTADDLKKLTGNDKKTAVTDLTSAFAAQNTELGKSKEAVDAVLFAIRASSVENEKARKVTEDAKAGTISYTQAVALLNKMDISPDLYVMLKKQALQYDENAGKASNTQRALSLLGVEVKLVGNNAQNAVVKIDSNTEAINKNETAADKAAKAQKNYADSLYDRYFDANFNKIILASGKTEGETKALLEAANYARKKGVEFTKEMANEALRLYKLESNVQDVLDKRKDSEKEITKEKNKQSKLAENQQKTMQINAKVKALSDKYDISSKAATAGIPKGLIEAMIMQESRGNKDAVGPVTKSGERARGLAQFMPATAKQYNVNTSSEESSINGMIKYMSVLIKQFGGDIDKAVMAYNAGPKNVQTGKAYGFKETKNYLSNVKSYTAGINGFSGSSKEFDSILKDAEKALEDQAKLRKSLELEVANEVTKIRENLKDKLIELDKAGFSPERTKELRDEFETRADNEIAIAKHALKTKLDDYGAFKKTESQLLEDSFNERKFYASRDLELTKEQRDKAVALLDEQLKQEQALLMLAQETRLFQYREALMAEAELVRERYRIEMLELSKIVDIEERRIAMQAKTTAFIRGNLAPVGTPVVESDKGKSNTQLLQEETGRELLAMQNRHLAAQVAAKDNANELLRIDKEYLAAKEQLHAEHDIKLVDARQADYESQLQIYSQIAGMTAQVFDQMAGMLRESVGESSALYKTMFLAGRAASIAQAIVNTEEGATKALAQGGAYGSLLAGVVRATGYASVGLIAGQTIAGYKSGGYTGNYGVNQEAGVVHGQEYVLNAAATKRVGVGTLDAINSGKSLGEKATVVQPQINVYTLPGETADVSMNSDGSLDVRIRKIAREEARAPWTALNDPNSYPSKQVQRNTTAGVKR